MTPPDDIPADPLDRIVRGHLDREAADVDAEAVLVRVRAGPSIRTAAIPRWSWLAPTGLAGLAAAVAVTFFLGGGPTPQPLTAAELVRDAQAAHAGPADRRYAVVTEWTPPPFLAGKLESRSRESRLWTRGDEFWVEFDTPTGRAMAWGRDPAGRVWVAHGRDRGFVYEPAELGEELSRYCDLMSLRLVSTLGELLEKYDLNREDAGTPGEPARVGATCRRRPGRPLPQYARVELEMDPTTKVVQQAELTREIHGRTAATLTFTLEETGHLPDDQYTLAGHLDPGAMVLDGTDTKELANDGRAKMRARYRDEVLRRLKFVAGVRVDHGHKRGHRPD